MKNKVFNCISIVSVLFFLTSFDLPKGWFKAGDSPSKYEMGIDKGAGSDGKNVATIKSIEKKIGGFGTLMQESKVGKYAGKKIKMSAKVKSENVTEWAGLWLRVDQVGSREPLAFDNMQDRAIKGNSDWKKYEIILDVPENASMLAYGCLLAGTGQVWFTNVTFEIIGTEVKSTESNNFKKSNIQSEPTNLNFEE